MTALSSINFNKIPFRDIQNIEIENTNQTVVNRKSKSNLENIPPTINALPFIKKSPRKEIHIGSLLEFHSSPRKVLGGGAGKTVMLMTALRKSVNTEKSGWKDVAYSNEFGNKIGQGVELSVLKRLSKNPQAKDLTPKVYYAGLHDSRLVIATKVISGGDARHCLPHVSLGDRLKALVNYGKGLGLLHGEKIIHNDTALRNMLIDWPKEKMSIDKALNYRLARPIFDQAGKTLIEAKEKITPEIQNKIKSLNISEVKVFVNKPATGMINDFDRCTFLGDLVSNVLLGCAIDCTAPERMLACNKYEVVKNDLNAPKEALKIARDRILLASTVKSDAFSFGQLLCDAILRPDLNTNLSENGEYNIACQKRMEKRVREYVAMSTASAIDPDDYSALNNIDPKLADIASGLMNYQPSMRLSIDEAISALEPLIPKSTSDLIYDRVFQGFDAAKNPPPTKPAFSMFANFSKEPITAQTYSGYNDT